QAAQVGAEGRFAADGELWRARARRRAGARRRPDAARRRRALRWPRASGAGAGARRSCLRRANRQGGRHERGEHRARAVVHGGRNAVRRRAARVDEPFRQRAGSVRLRAAARTAARAGRRSDGRLLDLRAVKQITGRRAFIELLLDEGITHLFGNPGTTELAIMEAVPEYPRLKFVLGLQESVVVAMADGYARASGRLAAANVHVMPGLGNAMGALYNAKFSGSPII